MTKVSKSGFLLLEGGEREAAVTGQLDIKFLVLLQSVAYY